MKNQAKSHTNRYNKIKQANRRLKNRSAKPPKPFRYRQTGAESSGMEIMRNTYDFLDEEND